MPHLDFTADNSLYATHGLHSYAAKCPPQLVRYGLRYYSKPGDRILDPMVGSGTTLVEARLMGRNAVGYDIDPLARLIAQVKCRYVHDLAISNAYDAIERRVTRDLKTLQSNRVSQALRDRSTPPDFPNRDYWFSAQVSEVLAILSSHIKAGQMDEAVRNFFFVAFSSLILARTSVANARDIIHSRHHFWQHPEPPDVMARFGLRVKRMRAQMAEFLKKSPNGPASRVEARVGDARCLKLREETFDLVFSSPPYATALDYPRAHFLAVPWLSSSIGVNFKEYWVNAPRYIGSERGRLSADLELDARIEPLAITASVIQKLSKNSQPHANLIQRYFVDMYQVLQKMHRVLKVDRHAIIVVCPSHIRKVIVPTHQVLVEMGELHGLKLKNSYTRTINKRRRLLPYLKEAFGKRMDLEYVLILQKTN